MKNALVILAGGKGERFGQKIPKQFYKIDGKTILDILLLNLDLKFFDLIVISVNKKYINFIKDNSNYRLYKERFIFTLPGKTRQISSFNALKEIKKYKIKNVLIHDAARPFCSNNLIKKILFKLNKYKNCIPYIEYHDRQIDKLNKKDIKSINIQTPQGFDFNLIFKAHLKYKNKNLPDDATLIEKTNKKIFLIKGENTNIKLTHKEDLVYLNMFKKPIVKSGIGYDIHQINKNSLTGLKLCGIKLPYPKLIGHSDADVGLHAICDSIFGALSMRDIGFHFPNTDKKWKNADSSKFIIYCRKILKDNNFFITNLDVNIIAEKPKISNYVIKMKKRISSLLQIKDTIISIKATTNEKIGFIGNGEGIAAEAIIQISDENIY